MQKEQIKISDIQTDPGFPFYAEYGILNDDYKIHSHDFNELFIITKGFGMHRIAKNYQELTPGDVFVIKDKEIQHGFENPKELELYNFIYNDEFIRNSSEDLYQLEGFQTLFVLEPLFSGRQEYRNRVRLNSESLYLVSCQAKKILDELTQRKPGYKTLVKALFIELIILLSREYSRPELQGPTHKLVRMGMAVAFLEKNFREPVTVTQLAQIAAVSERQFLRLFKTCFNSTPIKYINRLRVNYAKDMLKSQSTEMKDIAFHSGFNDPNYFARKFREITGTTPTNYRSAFIHNS